MGKGGINNTPSDIRGGGGFSVYASRLLTPAEPRSGLGEMEAQASPVEVREAKLAYQRMQRRHDDEESGRRTTSKASNYELARAREVEKLTHVDCLTLTVTLTRTPT